MITPEQTRRVAQLAALDLSEDEVEHMRSDLASILDHAEQIAELDLSEVQPTSQVVPLVNVLRPDVPRPSSSRETMLERAPDPLEGAFRVPSTQVET